MNNKINLSSVEGIDSVDFSKKFSQIEDYNLLFKKFEKNIQQYYQQSNILIGNGIDELIDVLLLFLKHKQGLNKILLLDPCYGRYTQSAQRFNFEINKFPRFIFQNQTFVKNPIKNIIKFINNNNVEIILFSNPGNPTPDYYPQSEILELLNNISSKIIVIIDEAFIEYAVEEEALSSISLLKKYKNLFVLRTFSKAFGLFGLRIGCLFNIGYINYVNNYKRLYTIPQPSIESFLEIFQLHKFKNFRKNIYKENHKRRWLFFKYFQKHIVNFLIYDGETNFVLIYGKSPIKKDSAIKCKDVTNKFNIKNYYFYRMTIPELNQFQLINNI